MNIKAKNLSKIYGDGENRVVALDRANLEIVSSDFISIMGPSGSGKSTLLHLLSGLDAVSHKRFCRHKAEKVMDCSFGAF